MVECNKTATQTEISMLCHVMTILSFFGWFVGWWVGWLVGPWVVSEFNKKKVGSWTASVPTLKRFLPTSLHGMAAGFWSHCSPSISNFGDTLEGVENAGRVPRNCWVPEQVIDLVGGSVCSDSFPILSGRSSQFDDYFWG